MLNILKAKGCLNGHETDKKKAGPTHRVVGAKYQGKKDAAGELIAKIKEGMGHPKVEATDAELNAAVEYVLVTK